MTEIDQSGERSSCDGLLASLAKRRSLPLARHGCKGWVLGINGTANRLKLFSFLDSVVPPSHALVL